MAERVGFEPTVRLRVQRFSRPPRSTTPAPLREISLQVERASDPIYGTSGGDKSHPHILENYPGLVPVRSTDAGFSCRSLSCRSAAPPLRRSPAPLADRRRGAPVPPSPSDRIPAARRVLVARLPAFDPVPRRPAAVAGTTSHRTRVRRAPGGPSRIRGGENARRHRDRGHFGRARGLCAPGNAVFRRNRASRSVHHRCVGPTTGPRSPPAPRRVAPSSGSLERSP